MALPASGSEDESESESDGGAESEDGEKPEKPVVDAKTLKKAKQQIAKAEGSGERGVVYLGNIPFGFYEEEMKAFFNQFGTVTRLRMSRSKKTGRSRGYAFIEFKDKEVADIVAETMNNYLMFNRLLKCQVIPAERVHEETFKNAHRAFRQMDWRKFEQRRHNKARDAQQTEKVVKRLVNNEKKTRAKLQKLGIDYDFPGYVCLAGATLVFSLQL
jgi:nucleolar protein 15